MDKNRILTAIKHLILFSATIHLLLLLVFAIEEGDITYINYFNILDLDFFFPGIEQGFWSQMASLVTGLALFGFFYFRSPTS